MADEKDPPKSALVAFKANKDLSRRVGAKFDKLLAKRMELYQCDALDALHDLAMMPISDNSMQNQVKFMAASRLAGNKTEAPVGGGDMDKTLAALNDQYHKTAPKIKLVRERVIEFHDQPTAINGN